MLAFSCGAVAENARKDRPFPPPRPTRRPLASVLSIATEQSGSPKRIPTDRCWRKAAARWPRSTRPWHVEPISLCDSRFDASMAVCAAAQFGRCRL